ncbi:class D beta-lactamase [Accumulibacter sp.]|uniref:class D beta-lactamase n=1 Tax=Accumulibacter sp. TaxID=2053492 RepID=UPI0025E69D88|nr:class D beta-lactamase [Accumulibacter sp.]MCM8624782.1 class D beta-lactamase [Accumulibacter sp.]
MPKNLLTAISIFCFAVFAHAEDTAMADLFSKAGVAGTLLIESARTGQRFVHDDACSHQAFTAASTFKVLNTLIALEEGVIGGADSTIRWNGTVHEIADWNRDQTLETAFKVSCVWCYQELAQRVGAKKYPAYIRRSHCGELREPFDGTQFWLDGSLTISAEQQVAFLKQVASGRLPFRATSYATLKSIRLAEETPDYRLYAKTGWATRNAPAVGWYVGYLEVADDVWLFALNMETRSAADLPLGKQITLEAFRSKGILPANWGSAR